VKEKEKKKACSFKMHQGKEREALNHQQEFVIFFPSRFE